jgi:hypothetical protein
MQAYFLLTCKPGHEKEIITHLKSLQEVVEVNGIWGKYDIFVKVSYEDPFGLDHIVEKLRSIENITGTETMPILYNVGGSIDD